MKDESRSPGECRVAYAPARLAGWVRNARLAVVRRDVWNRVDVALGSDLVSRTQQAGGRIRCVVLDAISDQQMRELAQLEAAGTGDRLDTRLEGLQLLRRLGLKTGQAGKALGLPNAADATRLQAMATLPRAVLNKLTTLGLTENHGRWLLGLEADVALAALQPKDAQRGKPEGHGTPAHKVSVPGLKKWRKGYDKKRAEAAGTGSAEEGSATAEQTNTALLGWQQKIGLRVGQEVRLRGTLGNLELGIPFKRVDLLAGVLQALSHGHGEAPVPPETGAVRWLVFPILSDEELAYLAGPSED